MTATMSRNIEILTERKLIGRISKLYPNGDIGSQAPWDIVDDFLPLLDITPMEISNYAIQKLERDVGIIKDMLYKSDNKFRKPLTEKQLNFIEKLLGNISKIKQDVIKLREIGDSITLQEGKHTVEGTVLKLKSGFNQYGETFKMMVAHATQPVRIWVTVPSKIADDVREGDVVRFTATLKGTEDDPTFWFASRPKDASIVAGNVLSKFEGPF